LFEGEKKDRWNGKKTDTGGRSRGVKREVSLIGRRGLRNGPINPGDRNMWGKGEREGTSGGVQKQRFKEQKKWVKGTKCS